ncbi:unnamed protein product [Pieris brassicae]|uniref:Uncharacterized protein n=1 Tax=Pieris brassicae TaxID=7116 RepID=A0A9P0XLG7_PIEBR|nr:unnamed protein product [Pieris brassicae]
MLRLPKYQTIIDPAAEALTEQTPKQTNSGTFKAGAELNGQTLQKDASKNYNGKSPNINLVVLHRQQNRSNHSMMTYPDSSNFIPEMCCNPNQINVTKFFKKQSTWPDYNRITLCMEKSAFCERIRN